MNTNEIYSEILDLAVEIDEEMRRHNIEMDRLIKELMVVAQKLEGTSPDEDWTLERFADERLNEQLRLIYEDNHGSYVEELYRFGADIMNFTQAWNLNCIPMVKHIFWFSGDERLFGINLFSRHPALTVFGITGEDITEEEVRNLGGTWDFTPYPQYSQLVFRGASLEALHSLFEEIYSRRQRTTIDV